MVHFLKEFVPEYRFARNFSLFSTDGWWVNRWPFLGWLETFVKMAAWAVVPYVSRSSFASDGSARTNVFASKTFAFETAVMFLASFLLALAIIDRLVYREVVSILFVFPNNWAHWTVTSHMYRRGASGLNIKYLRVFCWLMLFGDVIKLVFFAVHDFSRLNIARYVLYVLVSIFAALYATILLVEYGYLTQVALIGFDMLRLSHVFPEIRE